MAKLICQSEGGNRSVEKRNGRGIKKRYCIIPKGVRAGYRNPGCGGMGTLNLASSVSIRFISTLRWGGSENRFTGSVVVRGKVTERTASLKPYGWAQQQRRRLSS